MFVNKNGESMTLLKRSVSESFPEIIEHNVVVAIHEIHIDGLEPTLKIKVIKFEDGSFMGIANLKVNNYLSLRPYPNEEDAFQDALIGFFGEWKNKANKSINVEENEDW